MYPEDHHKELGSFRKLWEKDPRAQRSIKDFLEDAWGAESGVPSGKLEGFLAIGDALTPSTSAGSCKEC